MVRVVSKLLVEFVERRGRLLMPSQLRRGLHFADGDHVSGGAEIAMAGVVLAPDGVEGAGENRVELLADAVKAPAVILQVLHPFEIADGDTAGVGENVGQNSD